MDNSHSSLLITVSILISTLLFLQFPDITEAHSHSTSETNVYIVYMGRRPHDDVELITASHHEMLAGVLGSKEAALGSIIYSYKHGFSGFAATLTKSQAQQIAELPGVLDVLRNQRYQLHTTRSWDYLGVSLNSPNGLLHKTNMGDDVIIGILDTGITPDAESFNDHGIGPIPKKWKGFCESGKGFNSTNCNKKIIGARYFSKGFEAEYLGRPINTTTEDLLSPRDVYGHGTHTASTAAGNIVENVGLFNGLARGTLRGGAPRARLAIYKVCWLPEGGVSAADVLKGMDEAIHDGVDVISLSLGGVLPLFPEVDKRDLIYYGAFHAAEKGIVVVCSGGNEGPSAESINNVAPWVITVAATSIDRTFPTMITLGNNQKFTGQAIFHGHDTGYMSLITPDSDDSRYCNTIMANETWATGRAVLCFHEGSELDLAQVKSNVLKIGAVGLIVVKNPSKFLDVFISDIPIVQVNTEIGTKILSYIRDSSNPNVRFEASKTHIGKPVSTNVVTFSSRGPNSLSPAILKPDIAAPGVNILAAVPGGYEIESGTSMSAPHVAGIAALLKSARPNWSPAAIKSAMLTTAWFNDPSSGEQIFAEGDTLLKPANPFDVGAGVVNPNAAVDPGLIYDIQIEDYAHYLCSMGYNDTAISQILGKPKFSCSSAGKNSFSVLDLNLPSITIPSLTSSPVTVTRTVTNVGAVYSEYKVVVQPPQGFTIIVKPNVLMFNAQVKKASYTVTVSTSHKFNTGYCFGSLTWVDGKHKVRSPVSVKTEYPEF